MEPEEEVDQAVEPACVAGGYTRARVCVCMCMCMCMCLCMYVCMCALFV